MAIRLSENFRALFYAPFYAAEATGAAASVMATASYGWRRRPFR